jgi:cytochrome b561
VSEAWENGAFLAHSVLTKLLMAVLVLHVAGAARRAVAGDGTLSRMLWKP